MNKAVGPEVINEAPEIEIHVPNGKLPNIEENIEEEVSFFGHSHFKQIDLEWDNINISTVQSYKKLVNGKRQTIKEDKIILNNISGAAKHGKFTAIMGPSGSGKTTLLNFLSGRITGKNLKIQGDLKVNSESIKNLEVIGNLVAYVMQDDILMGTSTPREAFMFAANLRLNNTKKEKIEKVEGLLKDLGLLHCANTKIGNAMIRGISGGERKRVSIGVELITDPSMVFLDEPTTGLDSQTSLNLILLLVKLAQQGRTVVSTIHQPNSELFNNFDNLLLLVRGNIIYQGQAKLAVDHFASIGYPCPKFSNPADYFMKIMNETGLIVDALKQKAVQRSISNSGGTITNGEVANGVGGGGVVSEDIDIENLDEVQVEKQFKQRIEIFVEKYKKSGQVEEYHKGILTEKLENHKMYSVAWFTQMILVIQRTLLFEVRNPMDVQLKILQYIIFSIMLLAVFYNLGTGDAGIQTKNGLIFMVAVLFSFGSINGSILTFSMERPIFIRERLSKSYATSAYFIGKCIAEMPFFALYPTIFAIIVYFSLGLNTSGSKFGITIAVGIVTYFAGSAFGLCISTMVKNIEVALSISPMILIPFMVFGGYFANQDSVPYFFYEFMYTSPFKYCFQALAQNEYEGEVLTGCGIKKDKICDPLGEAGFTEGIDLSIWILVILGFGVRFIAYLGLMFISSPKPPKFEKKKQIQE